MKQLLFLIFCIAFQYCFAYTNASLWPGKSVSVSVNASSGYTNPSWSTTNSTLQLNSSGFNCTITPKAYFAGTATVKCTYHYKVGTQTFTNIVEWNYTCNDTFISISPSSINMKVGEIYQLMPSYNYNLYMTPTVYYTGYDTSLISISSSGMVTAKKSGETTIYLTSNVGSNSAKCDINISVGNIDTGEKLNYLYDAESMTAIVTSPVDKSLNTYEIPKSTWFLEDYYVKGEYSVIGLGNNAFRDCQNLTHINLPSYITSFGYQIFCDCPSLSEVILPCNMTEIPNSMFLGCTSLQNIELPTGLTSIKDQAFLGCSTLKSINLPDKISELSKRSFAQCNSLQSITMPDELEIIGSEAFRNCNSLNHVVLNNNLKIIKSDAFSGCTNIAKIYCHALTPPIIENSYTCFSDETYKNAILYVYPECIDIYKNDTSWNKFINIETIDNAGIDQIPFDKINSFNFYDLNGNQVNNPIKGKIYIVKCSDGFIKIILQ